MGAELGKAFVQIVPSAKGISGSISKELGGEASSAGKSAGLNIAGAIKGAIAAAGIGTAIKSALEAGGNLQQSFGGLETLYGDAAEAAKKYATQAAAAGISANNYAEQAVSFGASLKQAFGGDTIKAAEAANTAILDMADNSAKMGTDITAIQTAYQGFAKQNYTMLDNLKLGYGGTKTEMERLLEDAQKLTGIEYNIDNLGDVYEAIHVIQTDLGLTGVAAQEASTTFTGSLGAMKAAGENLLANLALGEDITPALDTLGETVKTFVFDNLFPMIGNILQAVPDLLSGLGSMVISSLNIVSHNSGEIVQTGIDIVTSLVGAIVEAAPYLVEAALRLAMSLGEALINTDWVTVGTDLINDLRDSIDLAAGEILGMDTATVDGFLSGITAALPDVLSKGVEFITNIANGIMENIPQLVTTAGEIITQFASFLLQNMPTIMEKGSELLLNLVNGIINNLPKIVESVTKIIAQFVKTVVQNLPQILTQGITIIGKLVAGLIQAIPQIIAAMPQIINSIVNAFKEIDWPSVGRNLIEGIANGLSNAAGLIIDAAKGAAQSAFDAACDFLGINSPAKKGIWMGDMYDQGVALGITENMDDITKATDSMMDKAFSELQAPQANFNVSNTPKAKGQMTVNMTINAPEGMDVNALAEAVQQKLYHSVGQREAVYA